MLYRCTNYKCMQRRALKKHHTQYVRPPKCNACGRLLEHPDYWQMKKNIATTCHCGDPHFPHRSGSSIYCIGYTKELTQDQINEWNEYQRG